ncbi:hypothetical protein MCOR29_004466 [Pyricularia oryzae]|uniref:U4/U6.U5 small nuclear ribonucleoprotein 27kDa protein domain-containing protein n=1 Tax=Pyricularia grisea TaxID=148305 RepID=A0ABQ8NX82_PYRGI|nr:hypothetical protein MCOR33_001350 [Pyricularia grisea]KAI6323333.1 hypothetical protein MCOR29_004466 [Pyricularia oryzae]KAI6395526.1 hypothetical protein MCOR23_007028 [Pyricularia oryzae]KAI6438512.1 hypothetical protein MCOR24_000108 [Pyricularia oryzae]KAI6462784.1 hypothetical protein MCOR15_004486 [Pyricularia oryzae]
MAGDRRPRRDDGRENSGGFRNRHESDGRRDRRDRGDDYRRRDDDRDNRSRRYRSRSRSADRGGSHRDRRRDDRDRSRDREARDRPRRPQDDNRGDRRRGDERNPTDRERGYNRDHPPRDRDSRRSASPRRRSTSPVRDRRNDRETDLPTRTRGGPERSGAAMSVKVGSQDDEGKRGRDRDDKNLGQGDKPMGQNDDDDDDDVEVAEDDDAAAMQAMMGFGGFGTTKNTKILGNNVGAVRKEKKTEYRQYMNRAGGFNRPLSPTR